MKEQLEYINNKLEILYGDNNSIITIYGDGSWSVEIDSFSTTYGYYRTNANQGDTIEKLYEFIDKI